MYNGDERMKSSKIVFICEDDEAIAELFKIILEEEGYKVYTFTREKEINNKLKKIKPDIVILDLWMPMVNGKELTKKLKKNSKTKNIPIIIVSADSSAGKTAREAGADDMLQKPFEVDDLLELLRKYTTKNTL